jgi:hypothetical protein
MRQHGGMDGVAGSPTQVQHTLDNWYGVQVRCRRRLKRGYQGHGGHGNIMSNGTGGWSIISARGRGTIRERHLGLSHFYNAATPNEGYGDRPMSIYETCILRHVGGNVNCMKPESNDKGMISMAGNLKGLLQAGSVSMIEMNVEWKHSQ